MKTNKKQNQGYTLFEILIAITVGVILLGLMLSIYSLSIKSLHFGTTRAELTQDARVMSERMTRDIRESKAIATILPQTKTDQQNPPPKEIEVRDGHGTELKYIKYYISDTNLHRQIKRYYFLSNPEISVPFDAEDDFQNPPEVEILSDNVVGQYIQDIIFYGDNIVTFEMKIKKSDSSYTTKTSVYGRNL